MSQVIYLEIQAGIHVNLNSPQNTHAHALTNGGADEGRGVADVVETFLLDELGHSGGEVLVVGLHVVLQYQAAQRTSGLIWIGGGD